MNARLLGLYGGKDGGIPLDSIDKMKATLATGSAGAKTSEFVVFPEAGHAVHVDYRRSYVQGPAESQWKRDVARFKAHGVT